MDSFNVIKATGEQEQFSSEKFINSLAKSGIDSDEATEILEELKPFLYNGIRTKELYRKTSEILKNKNHPSIVRYKLKAAIMALGPSGYPFEKYVANLFQALGYRTLNNQYIMGHCVQHEIDVIAEKTSIRAMIECKFHGVSGIKTTVKTPLYVKARFDDLLHACQEKKECSKDFQEYWLVTNTKFTTDAIQYGECVKMNLLAWAYPKGKSLEKLVDELKLYPVTALNHLLSHKQIVSLLNSNVVLCKDILNDINILKPFGISKDELLRIEKECRLLTE